MQNSKDTKESAIKSHYTWLKNAPKIHVHLEFMYVTLFGKGVFADVIRLR